MGNKLHSDFQSNSLDLETSPSSSSSLTALFDAKNKRRYSSDSPLLNNNNNHSSSSSGRPSPLSNTLNNYNNNGNGSPKFRRRMANNSVSSSGTRSPVSAGSGSLLDDSVFEGLSISPPSEEERKKMNVIMLGTGGSGKSTVFKQLKCKLHLKPYF
jgi:hypothetical protein